MKKYTLTIIHTKSRELKLQVRCKGCIVCNLQLHKYWSHISWCNYFVIYTESHAGELFTNKLSDKMKDCIQRMVNREFTWDYGFTIYTK